MAGCLYVQGDKVKFTLQFRGREMQFQDEGSKMFKVCDVFETAHKQL